MLNSKTLRLSVDALSKSLKIDKKAAMFHLASAFDTSWNNLQESVAKNQSKYQNMSDIEIKLFLENMIDTFSHNLNLEPFIAEILVNSIEPFTKDKPKAMRIDKDSKGKEGVPLGEIFSEFRGEGGDSGMLNFLKEVVKENPELKEALGGLDNDEDLQNKMRISTPVDPGCYFDFYSGIMGWDFEEDSYIEEYTPYKSSFSYFSEDGELVPVYLFGHSVCPGDSGDDLDISIRNWLENNHSVGMIIYRLPCYKEIGGKTYCFVGAYYASGYWSPLVMSKKAPDVQHKEIGPDNFDLESPVLGVDFEVEKDQGVPLHLVFYSFVAGSHGDGEIRILNDLPVIQGIGGWKTAVVSPF